MYKAYGVAAFQHMKISSSQLSDTVITSISAGQSLIHTLPALMQCPPAAAKTVHTLQLNTFE